MRTKSKFDLAGSLETQDEIENLGRHHSGLQSKADLSPKTKPSLLLLNSVQNGSRIEIPLLTLNQRDEFVKFARHAVTKLDLDLQRKTIQYIESCENLSLRAFGRYFCEGWLKYNAEGNLTKDMTYQAEGLSAKILSKILSYESFSGLKGIDFGFGNGEVCHALSRMGAEMVGFDLSPFFVQCARNRGINARMAAIDGHPREFFKQVDLLEGSQDFVIATLVLDRLSKPRHFLENFFRTVKSKGFFAIQTLLPIIPRDDGPVEKPIVYTSQENQITPGKDLEEDKGRFLELIQAFGGKNIKVQSLSYSVTSLDGIQNYNLWSFSGLKG